MAGVAGVALALMLAACAGPTPAPTAVPAATAPTPVTAAVGAAGAPAHVATPPAPASAGPVPASAEVSTRDERMSEALKRYEAGKAPASAVTKPAATPKSGTKAKAKPVRSKPKPQADAASASTR